MKRVEIIGLSGAGKSTILKEFMKYDSERKWLTEKEALKRIAIEKAREKNILEGFIADIFSRFKIFEKQITHHYLYIHKSYLYINKWSVDHRDFLKKIMDSLNGIDTKFVGKQSFRFKWLIKKNENASIIDHSNGDDIVLIDESILQKIIYYCILLNKRFVENQKILNLSPKPHGVIYFKINPNESVERIKNRDGTKKKYFLSNEKHILKESMYANELFKKLVPILNNKNVPILCLENGMEINEYFSCMQNFLEKL